MPVGVVTMALIIEIGKLIAVAYVIISFTFVMLCRCFVVLLYACIFSLFFKNLYLILVHDDFFCSPGHI